MSEMRVSEVGIGTQMSQNAAPAAHTRVPMRSIRPLIAVMGVRIGRRQASLAHMRMPMTEKDSLIT